MHFTQLLTVPLVFLELLRLLQLLFKLFLLFTQRNLLLYLFRRQGGIPFVLICGSYVFFDGFMDVEGKVEPFDLVSVLKHLLPLRVVTTVINHARVGHKTHILLHELVSLFTRLNRLEKDENLVKSLVILFIHRMHKLLRLIFRCISGQKVINFCRVLGLDVRDLSLSHQTSYLLDIFRWRPLVILFEILSFKLKPIYIHRTFGIGCLFTDLSAIQFVLILSSNLRLIFPFWWLLRLLEALLLVDAL